MKLRSIVFVGLAAAMCLPASGCLRRRRVIVVHDAYRPPLVVEQPAAPPAPAAPSDGAMTAPEAPPAPKVETAPPAPSSSYTWVEGYWVYERGWRWRRGVWVLRPAPSVVWVPGHWVHGPHTWSWVPGHWQ